MDSNHRSLSRASRFILREVNCAGIDGAAKKTWRGTDGSNPCPSSGESPANLSFRRIEVQGRSREADGDSRGGEHQGCAAVQQLTASPAADATESNVSLARPEPLYECAADGPTEDLDDMANGESRTGQCDVGRQRGNDKEPTCRATSPKGNGCRRVHR